MPTFLQLYRLLSTYKLLKPPRFGNCSVEEEKPIAAGYINFDEFKNIFEEETALQNLKNRLDQTVEQDDWDGEDLIADNYQSLEIVNIVIY